MSPGPDLVGLFPGVRQLGHDPLSQAPLPWLPRAVPHVRRYLLPVPDAALDQAQQAASTIHGSDGNHGKAAA